MGTQGVQERMGLVVLLLSWSCTSIDDTHWRWLFKWNNVSGISKMDAALILINSICIFYEMPIFPTKAVTDFSVYIFPDAIDHPISVERLVYFFRNANQIATKWTRYAYPSCIYSYGGQDGLFVWPLPDNNSGYTQRVYEIKEGLRFTYYSGSTYSAECCAHFNFYQLSSAITSDGIIGEYTPTPFLQKRTRFPLTQYPPIHQVPLFLTLTSSSFPNPVPPNLKLELTGRTAIELELKVANSAEEVVISRYIGLGEKSTTLDFSNLT